MSDSANASDPKISLPVNVGIQIDPEQINKYVSDAIIGSAIGNQVKKAIESALTSYSFSSSIQKTIDAAVSQIIYDTVRKDHSELVRDKVKEAMATKVTDDFIEKITDAAFKEWLSRT